MSTTSAVRLVSVPQIDTGHFDLCLPLPDPINSGGFLMPTPSGSVYAYSNIDLTVCCIESYLLGETIQNLLNFYIKHEPLTSEHFVYVTYLQGDALFSESISMIKTKCVRDSELTRVMNKNAPITFRSVR